MMPDASNISTLITQCDKADAGRIALKDRAESLSYHDLAQRVQQAAAALRELGLQPGDRVAIIVDKQADVVAWMFGCYLAEAVLVPVNPALKAGQVRHILTDSGARLLVSSSRRQQLLETLADVSAMRLVLPGTGQPPVALTPSNNLPAPCPAPTGFDRPELATLFYTSGSTGLPKAVACTHDNILAGAKSVSSYLQNTREDTILAILPLSFDAGFSQLTTGFVSGATVVLRDYLLPRDIARACDEEGITGITGVPAIWTAALKAKWTDEARERIRYFANTGGHLPEDRISQLSQLFPNADPVPMYGLTEAFRSTYLPPDKVSERPGSIGKAIPGARLFVLNEHDEICSPGEPGELVHAGPTVALGYWNNPKETARRFRPAPRILQDMGISGQVVYSGDVVTYDADGFLYYRGRRDAQIKILGNRISFREIEDAAMALDQVRACVAGGRPANIPGADPSLVLFVEGDEQDGSLAEQVHAHLRAELPGYTVPSEIIVMAELIVNPNGKYDVNAMLSASALQRELTKQEG